MTYYDTLQQNLAHGSPFGQFGPQQWGWGAYGSQGGQQYGQGGQQYGGGGPGLGQAAYGQQYGQFGGQPTPMSAVTQAGSAAGSLALFALKQAPWIKQAAKRVTDIRPIRTSTGTR